MVNMNIYSFKNSVDPDQLAYENPSDQDPRCFLLIRLQLHDIDWNLASYSIIKFENCNFACIKSGYDTLQ